MTADIAHRTEMDDKTQEALRVRGARAMREINEKIRSVLEDAPSDASARLTLHRSQRGYKGVLRINSRQRRFIGGGTGAKFSEVVEQIFREVQEQIGEWKKERFADLV